MRHRRSPLYSPQWVIEGAKLYREQVKPDQERARSLAAVPPSAPAVRRFEAGLGLIGERFPDGTERLVAASPRAFAGADVLSVEHTSPGMCLARIRYRVDGSPGPLVLAVLTPEEFLPVRPPRA